jgi:hypothetical protein
MPTMPPLVPYRFLLHIEHPCPYFAKMPTPDGKHLLDLPKSAFLNPFAELDERTTFAEVRLAWNEAGLGLTCDVLGKKRAPVGDAERPRGADGLSFWFDTRGDRTSHRATKTCHLFHLMPTGGGPDKDEPALRPAKINRAMQNAPLCNPGDVPFRSLKLRNGYRLEEFFPAKVLHGYDPEESPICGVYYSVRDAELGEQTLGVGPEFPFWDNPTLWDSIQLRKPVS